MQGRSWCWEPKHSSSPAVSYTAVQAGGIPFLCLSFCLLIFIFPFLNDSYRPIWTQHSWIFSLRSSETSQAMCFLLCKEIWSFPDFLKRDPPRSTRTYPSSLCVCERERFIGPTLVFFSARVTRVFLKHKTSLAGWACVQPGAWMRLCVYVNFLL